MDPQDQKLLLMSVCPHFHLLYDLYAFLPSSLIRACNCFQFLFSFKENDLIEFFEDPKVFGAEDEVVSTDVTGGEQPHACVSLMMNLI